MSSAVQRHRWTRKEYDRMVVAGGFGADTHIELLDGELWEMTPQDSRHSTAYELTGAALRSAFAHAFVRHQIPFALDQHSAPEPDLAVVPGSIRDYADGHPSAALLIVEVSDSSLQHDRVRKLAAYARNGIPEYWILDLQQLQLEVYREPADGVYRTKAIYAAGDSVSPMHAPEAVIDIADLLP